MLVRNVGGVAVVCAVGMLLGVPGRLPAQTRADVLASWNGAEKLQGQGRLAEAAREYEKALRLARLVLGDGHLDTATLMNNLANLYSNMGQYSKAEPLHVRSLQIREVRLGKDHLDVGSSLNNLAYLYKEMGQFDKAEPLFQRSILIREARLGKDHLDVAQTLGNLAGLYTDMGQYGKAEPLYLRNLQILEARVGTDHLFVAASLNSLATVYWYMGQYGKAEPLFQRSLQIREARLGKDHHEVASSLLHLANMYTDMGQYGKAELLYLRSLQIYEAKVGKDHPDVALVLHNLALLYNEMGQYGKAEPLYQRSLLIRETRLGKDHAVVAESLNNLASLYAAMGQYGKAEPLFQRSLQIREARLGKDHPFVAAGLNNLATLYRRMGQYDKAEPLYERSLQILETTLGKVHPRVAASLGNLAALYSYTGQDGKAEPLFRRSLLINETTLGENHPDVANSLHNLATLYRSMGQYGKAEPLFRRSLKIREATLGKDHPAVADSLNGLAWTSAGQHEWTRAVGLVQKARQANANHLAEVLPVLAEKEQLTLLRANVEGGFHLALSLGWAARHEATAASAEWLLNGKALAHQSLAEQHLLARDAKDPKARQLVEDLQQTRSRLAALVNRLPRPGLEAAYQQEMQELRSSEQDLAQKLARAVGRPYRAMPWVKLDELRAKLGPRTAFVDIARFRVFDFQADKWIGLRYVAWVTPPEGKDAVQLIDLGEAAPIDRLVEQVRQSLIDSARSVTKVGEVEASAALQKPLQELSAKVLHPLLPALAKYEEWIICPDGALWLTPWNALLLPDGKFAVEKHLIRHVVSGRDLVLELPGAKAASAFVFADPDYDLSPGKVLAAAGGLRSLPASTLLGQRLRGAIGTWNVSFEFLGSEVLIRDEDGDGGVAGKGTWKQEGNSLTIRTSLAVFQGTIEANSIRGQRSKRNDDGTVTRDTFRMDRPRGESGELRSTGAGPGALPKVPRLPGTAAEAEAVRPKIRQWLGQEPKMFLEGQASEAMLKTIKSPRVLVLATHGYFLPTQEVEQKDRPGLDLGEDKRSAALLDNKGQPIENPLLRCGLLLAGCNKGGEAQAGEDDGILTGLEIVGLDLRGCELVVLSACETGLGDVRNGEGVAGLRQAFQLAGAKGVLASLWQVPDRETALLMNAFYGELAKGRSQAEALRQAQLQRIAARRGQFGAAHPFFWAAFALTSRGTD